MRYQPFLLMSASLLVAQSPFEGAVTRSRSTRHLSPSSDLLSVVARRQLRLRTKLNDLLAQELTRHWYPHAGQQQSRRVSSIDGPRLVAPPGPECISCLSSPYDLDGGGVRRVFTGQSR